MAEFIALSIFPSLSPSIHHPFFLPTFLPSPTGHRNFSTPGFVLGFGFGDLAGCTGGEEINNADAGGWAPGEGNPGAFGRHVR